MNLEEKLYTSTEVAEILGVSLRSVYRYLEEGKLTAEIKTATGRLRFTRQNIMDFLRPTSEGVASSDISNVSVPAKPSAIPAPQAIPISAPTAGFSSPQVPVSAPSPQVAESPVEVPAVASVTPAVEVSAEPVDWLSRFRSSADKFKSQQPVQAVSPPARVSVPSQPVAQVPQPTPVEVPAPTEFVSGLSAVPVQASVATPEVAPAVEIPVNTTIFYYRSMLGGLKDIAQGIDKSSRKGKVPYAFTMHAGMSLIQPLKDPFSLLHAYIKSGDKAFFEKMLRLSPSDEDNAQLCLILSEESSVYANRVERHGLYVVSSERLKEDLARSGEKSLATSL